MQVAQLWVYPIKSCRGVRVDTARVSATGFEHDRQFMVVQYEEGSTYMRFVTQRNLPRMALIEPSLQPLADGGLTLRLEGPGVEAITLAPATAVDDAAKVTVKVWSDYCPAIDQGDAVARWLTAFLGRANLRLVRFDDKHQRRLEFAYSQLVGPQEGQLGASFADGFPYLIATEASLQQLNAELAAKANGLPDAQALPLPMARFRPNIVLTGNAPFEEDTWSRLRIAGLTFYLLKACSRCKMTTVDPAKGEFMADGSKANPQKHLLETRDWGRGGLFGQNAACLPLAGAVQVGDAVEVLARRSPQEQEWDKKALPKPLRSVVVALFAATFLLVSARRGA